MIKIQHPGFYRQHDGERSLVTEIRGERAYGFTRDGVFAEWSLNGTYFPGFKSTKFFESFDLVAAWEVTE